MAQAETETTELEVTAGQQLKQMARQTELALETAQAKLKHTQVQRRELQTFVKVSCLESHLRRLQGFIGSLHRHPWSST